MNKIIATDLDGTLFYPKDHKKMICDANLYFLQSFLDEGGRVILVTGRSLDYGKKVIQRIGRDCSVISYNGGCVYSEGKIIYERVIENLAAKQIIDDAYQQFKNPGVFLMSENGLFIHLKFKSKFLRSCYKFYYKTLRVYAEKIDYEEEGYLHELQTGRIFKIMLYFGLGKRNREYASQTNKVIRQAYPDIESSWSGNVIELTAKDCSKAKALLSLCDKENIDKDKVYVVGDSGNDISMFKAFYEHSFCMGHSPAIVSKYAKYTINKFEDLSRYILEK